MGRNSSENSVELRPVLLLPKANFSLWSSPVLDSRRPVCLLCYHCSRPFCSRPFCYHCSIPFCYHCSRPFCYHCSMPFSECPTFGQYLIGIFDRVAVSRGRSPRILRGPPKFLQPGGPETPFPALSDKYLCQKRFGKLIVISRLFSRLVFTAGSKLWEVTKRKRPCTNGKAPLFYGTERNGAERNCHHIILRNGTELTLSSLERI